MMSGRVKKNVLNDVRACVMCVVDFDADIGATVRHVWSSRDAPVVLCPREKQQISRCAMPDRPVEIALPPQPGPSRSSFAEHPGAQSVPDHDSGTVGVITTTHEFLVRRSAPHDRLRRQRSDSYNSNASVPTSTASARDVHLPSQSPSPSSSPLPQPAPAPAPAPAPQSQALQPIDYDAPEPYLFGVSYFRQRMDESLARGCEQQAVVLLSVYPLFHLLRQALPLVASMYFRHGVSSGPIVMRQMARWPAHENLYGGCLRVLSVKFGARTLKQPLPVFSSHSTVEVVLDSLRLRPLQSSTAASSGTHSMLHSSQSSSSSLTLRAGVSSTSSSSSSTSSFTSTSTSSTSSSSSTSSTSAISSKRMLSSSSSMLPTSQHVPISGSRPAASLRITPSAAASGSPMSSSPRTPTQALDSLHENASVLDVLNMSSNLVPSSSASSSSGHTLAISGEPLWLSHVHVYDTFHQVLPLLWHLWEIALTGQSIIVLGASPEASASAVLGIMSLISPLVWIGDYRPYLTVNDDDFPQLAKMQDAGLVSRVILGVTNPYIVQRLDRYPFVLSLGEHAHVLDCVMDEQELSSTIVAPPRQQLESAPALASALASAPAPAQSSFSSSIGANSAERGGTETGVETDDCTDTDDTDMDTDDTDVDSVADSHSDSNARVNGHTGNARAAHNRSGDADTVLSVRRRRAHRHRRRHDRKHHQHGGAEWDTSPLVLSDVPEQVRLRGAPAGAGFLVSRVSSPSSSLPSSSSSSSSLSSSASVSSPPTTVSAHAGGAVDANLVWPGLLTRPSEAVHAQLLSTHSRNHDYAEVASINNSILRRHFRDLTSAVLYVFRAYFVVDPARRRFHPYLNPPVLPSFREDTFLAHVASGDVHLPRNMSSMLQQVGLDTPEAMLSLYSRLLRSPAFFQWFHERRRTSQAHLDDVVLKRVSTFNVTMWLHSHRVSESQVRTCLRAIQCHLTDLHARRQRHRRRQQREEEKTDGGDLDDVGAVVDGDGGGDAPTAAEEMEVAHGIQLSELIDKLTADQEAVSSYVGQHL